jgi:HemK-like putative methylase
MSDLTTNFKLNKKYSREIKSLLAFVCKRDLSWLLSHDKYQLSESEELLFKQIYQLLLSGTPLAYIIGQQAFYNYNFKVSPSVLIPRPESELIVDTAKEYLGQCQKKMACLDIGTGSGAIIISLAAELQKITPTIFGNCKFMAGDISTEAIRQAQANAHDYKLDDKIKDWKIAQYVFGRNDKVECKFIKLLRRHYTIEKLNDDWCVIFDTNLNDDCGWLIPNDCLV